jgi:hypothetical protein
METLMPDNLIIERTHFLELRRRLLELYPDLDDQTLNDTLEGATNFREAIAALIRSAIEDETLSKALKERIETMRGRLARLEARASNKRLTAVESMLSADMQKLTFADFTASLRSGPPSIEILNEDKIPIDFLVPQPPKPDKRAILQALTQGAIIPGALLTEPKLSLSIRRS